MEQIKNNPSHEALKCLIEAQLDKFKEQLEVYKTQHEIDKKRVDENTWQYHEFCDNDDGIDMEYFRTGIKRLNEAKEQSNKSKEHLDSFQELLELAEMLYNEIIAHF